MLFKYSLLSVLATLPIIIIIYYFRLDDFTIRFVWLFFAYFFLYLLFAYKTTVPHGLLIPIIYLPPLLIDASVFLTAPELVPLRFPFASIFPLLGILAGYLFVQKKYPTFATLVLGSVLFFFVSKTHILPTMLLNMQDQRGSVVKKESYAPIFEEALKTEDGTWFKLKDTAKAKCLLLEFYYVDCPVCEQKLPSLQKLADTLATKDFKIIMICDGKASRYSEFVKHAQKNRHLGFTFLYDSTLNVCNNVVRNYDRGYPTEVIVDENYNWVSTHNSFAAIAKEEYERKNIEKINQVLK
jgi:peroxiredoxin